MYIFDCQQIWKIIIFKAGALIMVVGTAVQNRSIVFYFNLSTVF